jgi:histone-lysine N-methyltransferase SUV39H
VIPSPSRQLKKQIEQSQWVKPPPWRLKKTALSTEYYPIQAHEKHTLKAADPSARKLKRSEMS